MGGAAYDGREIECPELTAYPHGGSQWKVWCEYCHRYHYHGVGEGHREAHCTNPDSPYLRTGYRLVLGQPSGKLVSRAEVRRRMKGYQVSPEAISVLEREVERLIDTALEVLKEEGRLRLDGVVMRRSLRI